MKRRILRTLFLAACLLGSLLLLVACGGDDAGDDKATGDKNAITAVTLEEGTITVKVSMTQSFLSGFSDDEVYLLELPSHRNTVGDLSGLEPVGTDDPSGSLTFTVPERDGMRSRRYSSFVLASKDKAGNYLALTSAKGLANPEVSAPEGNGVTPASSSIKGLISSDPADALRLGVAHTVVDVYINELLQSGWSEDAEAYVTNGVTAYLNGDALEALDETVRRYTDAGVQVYLRFRLSARNRTDACAEAGLYFEGTEETGADGLSINVGSAKAATTMEGFFAFMADRYASPEEATLPVTAFILGYAANNPTAHASAGKISTDEYISNYEKLVHTAHIAIKSQNSDGRAYISVDSRRVLPEGGSGWDAAAFLAAFRDEADLRGNYAWHVAGELYAASTTIWMESSADTSHYTVRNLATLTGILNGETYKTPDGGTRRLLISGFSVPAALKGEVPSDAQNNNQAASYAFAYMTALRDGGVEALIYDRYADRYTSSESGSLTGLWTVTGDNRVPDEKRPIYKIFKEIDTSSAPALTPQLSSLIGSAYEKLDSALVGTPAPVSSVSGVASLANSLPEGATTLLNFGTGTLAGMTDAGGATFLELRPIDEDGKEIALHARFNRATAGSPMALATTVNAAELAGGKLLLLDLSVSERGEEPTAADSSVTLRLCRPAKGDDASGAGAVVYESTLSGLKNGVRQKASFNIADLTELVDAEDTLTLTVLIDNPSGDSFDLYLAGAHVTDVVEEEEGSIGPVVLIIIIVALVAVIGVVVFLVLRKRKWDY